MLGACPVGYLMVSGLLAGAYIESYASNNLRDLRRHLGSCAVFARMARDFGDDTLPVHSTGQYLPGSHAPSSQVANWDMLTLVMGRLLSSCVEKKGQPGWSARVGDIVVFFVPQDSAFRRRWWRNELEIDGTNVTGSVTSS